MPAEKRAEFPPSRCDSSGLCAICGVWLQCGQFLCRVAWELAFCLFGTQFFRAAGDF